jgi:ribonuclease D
MTMKQKASFDRLLLLRDHIAQHENLAPHIIASKDQLREYVVTGKTDHFRTWQKELLKL